MISIVSPCYNVEPYLPRYIDSIISQTYTDWELILVDDGSDDRSGAICDEYAARDERIRVIHKQNAGVSEARNAGIELCRGKYLAFFDTDDWIEPDTLRILSEACESTGCDMAACDVFCVTQSADNGMVRVPDKKWGNIRENRVVSGKEMYYGVLNKSATIFNKLFSFDKVRKLRFDRRKHYGEDTDYLLRAMEQIQSAVLSPYMGYNYFFKRPGNVVSHGIDKRTLELIDNAIEVYHTLKKIGLNALGVYRIHVAVMEALRKIPVEQLGDDSMKIYLNACKDAVRLPPLRDRVMFFCDRHFSMYAKRRYLMNLLFPGFRTLWKRLKLFCLGEAGR